MSNLGNQTSNKETTNGKLYFDNKDLQYLNKLSREATEKNHDFSILYFQVDWKNSKRNFYGETTIKVFKNTKGIPVRAMLKLTQGEEQQLKSIPNKIMKLVVSCYHEQLIELNISPQIGDYFAIGKRIYNIYDKTLDDVGPGNVMLNRKKMRVDYMCIQEDDEAISNGNPWLDNLENDNNLNLDVNNSKGNE